MDTGKNRTQALICLEHTKTTIQAGKENSAKTFNQLLNAGSGLAWDHRIPGSHPQTQRKFIIHKFFTDLSGCSQKRLKIEWEIRENHPQSPRTGKGEQLTLQERHKSLPQREQKLYSLVERVTSPFTLRAQVKMTYCSWNKEVKHPLSLVERKRNMTGY